MMVCVLGHPSRLASLAPQRLCWPSSVLPFSVVPEDSIEDGEELSGDCDESDHFQQRWCPSDPVLAQSGFASGPSDCSGSMERRTESRAEVRTSSSQDEPVFRPPPHPLL